jgi:hypothetical protein
MRTLAGAHLTLRRLVPVVFFVTAPACMGVFDIFNRSTKDLPAGYCLELDREFKHYRVQDCSGRRKVEEGVGVLEGIVTDIGWNDRAIVAKRVASFGGDASGWMVIDVSTDQIEGAFSDQAIRGKLASDPRLKGIDTKPVESVLN